MQNYPVHEIIVHPRTAAQKYEGTINTGYFAQIIDNLECPLVYNGDVITLDDYNIIIDTFPSISGVMIGRGALRNPALLQEIETGKCLSADEKKELMSNMITKLFHTYRKILCGDIQFLQKMKSICTYMVPNEKKYKKEYKRLFKTNNPEEFLSLIDKIIPNMY